MAGNVGGYLATRGGAGGGGGGRVNASGFISGGAIELVDPLWITAESISGGKAVGFNQSGAIQIAMGSISGRMPAIGVVKDNVTSGQPVIVYRGGPIFNNSGSTTPFNFSGLLNNPIYVGASGDIVASGAPQLSGNIQQIIGVSISQSGMEVQLGDPLESVILQSGDIGSGSITGASQSGFMCIASGSLGTYDASSGMTVRNASFVSPFQSGTAWSLNTQETISGGRAVGISQSGNLWIAMAAVSGRMPAIGFVVDNVLSGIPANVYTQGPMFLSSGLVDFSGYLGKPVWVGRSGQVVSFSGSFNSGGFNVASGGDFIQRFGVAHNSGGFVVLPDNSLLQNQLLAVNDLVDVVNRGFGV